MSWRNPNVIVFSGMSPDGAAVEELISTFLQRTMLETPPLDKADEKGFGSLIPPPSKEGRSQ